MATDSSKVFVGSPDQATRGAVLRAPLGTPYPANARDPFGVAFEDGGFVSDGGVTVTPELGTTDLVDWSGATIRKLLESFSGTISWEFVQLSATEAKLLVGDGHVEVTPATGSAGEQLKIALGAHLPEPGVWGFAIKDGERLVKVIAPNAQPFTLSEIPLLSNDAIKLGTELACYPDAAGNAIYILTDDGVFAGSTGSAGWSVTVTATGGTYSLSVNGFATAPIAFDANATAITSAVNGLQGVTGVTVTTTGTTTKTLTFSAPVVVTGDGSELTGPDAGLVVDPA